MNTTGTDRTGDVRRMPANFAMEGLLPDATDLLLQGWYAEGKLTLDDLLAYAKAYAERRDGRLGSAISAFVNFEG